MGALRGWGREGDQEPADLAGQDLSVLLSTLAFSAQSASPHFSLQMKRVPLEPGHCCSCLAQRGRSARVVWILLAVASPLNHSPLCS